MMYLQYLLQQETLQQEPEITFITECFISNSDILTPISTTSKTYNSQFTTIL